MLFGCVLVANPRRTGVPVQGGFQVLPKTEEMLMNTELRRDLSSQGGTAGSFPCSLFPGNGDLCLIPVFYFPQIMAVVGSFPCSLFPDNGDRCHSHSPFSWMMGRRSSPSPCDGSGGFCSSPDPRVFIEPELAGTILTSGCSPLDPHLWILTSGWQCQVTAGTGTEMPPCHRPLSPPHPALGLP